MDTDMGRTVSMSETVGDVKRVTSTVDQGELEAEFTTIIALLQGRFAERDELQAEFGTAMGRINGHIDWLIKRRDHVSKLLGR